MISLKSEKPEKLKYLRIPGFREFKLFVFFENYARRIPSKNGIEPPICHTNH